MTNSKTELIHKIEKIIEQDFNLLAGMFKHDYDDYYTLTYISVLKNWNVGVDGKDWLHSNFHTYEFDSTEIDKIWSYKDLLNFNPNIQQYLKKGRHL